MVYNKMWVIFVLDTELVVMGFDCDSYICLYVRRSFYLPGRLFVTSQKTESSFIFIYM